MISIKNLVIFWKVAETENFTKAAEALYITQSAVSHAMKELEERTGTPLFERLPKKVRITSAGKLLLEEVTPIITECAALEKRMEHLEKHAPVRIVSGITIAGFWLPKILLQFKEKWKDIQVYVDVVPAAEAMKRLQAGEADIALIEGIRPEEKFVSHTFGQYPLKIVCSVNYPIQGQEILLQEFCSQDLLLREKGSAIRETLEHALFYKGFEVKPIWISVNSAALIQAAKEGLGITILPDVLVKEEIEKKLLKQIKVKDFELANELHLVYHKDKYITAPLKTLIAMIAGKEVL